MEGTMAEIRMFAGNFNPRTWQLCNGQLLSIAQYSALFSLVGTIYGGNGQTTFGLPDFRGRVAVGEGTGAGLTMVLGQVGGTNTTTLLTTNLPAHTHTATGGSGGSGTATLNAVSANGNSQNPTGNFLAASRNASAASYAASGTACRWSCRCPWAPGRARAATAGRRGRQRWPVHAARDGTAVAETPARGRRTIAPSGRNGRRNSLIPCRPSCRCRRGEP